MLKKYRRLGNILRKMPLELKKQKNASSSQEYYILENS
jgi:hypothetical protein